MPHLPAARIGTPISQLNLPTAPTGMVGNPAAMVAAAAPGPGRPPLLGVASVRINGQPAAVTGTVCTCAIHAPLGPANVVLPPIPPRVGGQVLIGGFPAARVGDRATCQAGIVLSPADAALPKVLIGG